MTRGSENGTGIGRHPHLTALTSTNLASTGTMNMNHLCQADESRQTRRDRSAGGGGKSSARSETPGTGAVGPNILVVPEQQHLGRLIPENAELAAE